MRERCRVLELSWIMAATVRGSLVVGGLLLSSLALAQEKQAGSNVDTEHIFGFTEGADIGDKGEEELESITIARLSKQGGFADLTNETSYRYGVERSFRASVGTLTDYYSVHDSPGYLDRRGLRYSGLTSEFRWQFSEHDSAPVGLTLSFAPTWRQVNDPTPGQSRSLDLPLGLLVDRVLVPDRVFLAVNATVTPSFVHVGSGWQSYRPLEISAALSVAVGDRFFLGGEIRQAAQNQTGMFADRALFIGPSFFVRLRRDLTFKVAWSAQIPDVIEGRLDLANYERHQFVAQFAYGF